jgi:Pyridine nucleotide-disulphide oxidoreductase
VSRNFGDLQELIAIQQLRLCRQKEAGSGTGCETLGLEELGIKTQPFVEVDQKMQTRHPNIYAIGDVNGPRILDSTALA